MAHFFKKSIKFNKLDDEKGHKNSLEINTFLCSAPTYLKTDTFWWKLDLLSVITDSYFHINFQGEWTGPEIT